jgi:hypothetical protein
VDEHVNIGGTMQRSVVSVVAAVVLSAGLVACGSDGDGSGRPHAPQVPMTSSQPSSATDEASPSPSGTPLHGKLGDTFALQGLDPRATANVACVKLLDPAHASLGYFEAGPGKRLVAARFELTSNGTQPYSGAGYAEARVFDSAGKFYGGVPSEIKEGETLSDTMNLQPGEKTSGWVVFKVPQDAKIASVRYQMDNVGPPYDREATWTLS